MVTTPIVNTSGETGIKAALKRNLRKWTFWVAVLGVAFTVGIIIGYVFYWDSLSKFDQFGYLGAFIISVFGGATILAPIPMTPMVFAIGSITKPAFAPELGPVFVGICAGMGETIGGIIIYMTGYSGGSAILTRKNKKLEAAYAKVMGWMQKRGSLILFILSAVINPFFYPAAITAGVLKFGIRKFVIITMMGKTIKGITVAAAGYWGLGSLLRAIGVPI